jgi:hypothetical protein
MSNPEKTYTTEQCLKAFRAAIHSPLTSEKVEELFMAKLKTPEQSFVEKYLSIAVEYYSEEEKQRIFKMRAELIQSYVDEQIEKLRREFLGGK